jgi:hypothetical protein
MHHIHFNIVHSLVSTGIVRVSSQRLSKLDRSLLGLSKPSLAYGEITFEALAEVLYRHVPLPPRGGVFIDLGSGTGRAVMGAAMLHKFYRVAGVEILPSLHEAALFALGEYRTRMRIASGGGAINQKRNDNDGNDADDAANLATQFMASARTPRRFQIERERAAAAREAAALAGNETADGATTSSDSQQQQQQDQPEGEVSAASEAAPASSSDSDDALLQGPPSVEVTDVALLCGDFLEVDWWTAGDIVFANATAFDDALMAALGERALRMKKGSYFITVTKPLPSFHFKSVHQGMRGASLINGYWLYCCFTLSLVCVRTGMPSCVCLCYPAILIIGLLFIEYCMRQLTVKLQGSIKCRGACRPCTWRSRRQSATPKRPSGIENVRACLSLTAIRSVAYSVHAVSLYHVAHISTQFFVASQLGSRAVFWFFILNSIAFHVATMFKLLRSAQIRQMPSKVIAWYSIQSKVRRGWIVVQGGQRVDWCATNIYLLFKRNRPRAFSACRQCRWPPVAAARSAARGQ